MANRQWGVKLQSLVTYIRFKLRLPKDRENMETTIESVRAGATMTGANLWVLVTAIFTASLGLNVNSTAVIIGAMLISPLMGPIMAIGMGVAIHDFALVYRAIKNFTLAVALSILASSIYFFISPLKVPGSELLARTSPTVYDVMIAIFGGLAGIIAGSGKLRQSNVVPGVAIATALMPPLCTVGFGIANLDLTYILGAFYLFFINTVFISLSTYFIVRILKYPPVENVQGRRAGQIKRTIWLVVLITLLPSIYLTYQIVRKYVFEEKAKAFVQKEFEDRHRIVIKTVAEFKKTQPVITITLLGAELDSTEFALLKSRLPAYGLGNARLDINQDITNVIRRGALSESVLASHSANTEAISRLYRDIDTLKAADLMPASRDSMQAGLGRELAILMPDLRTFRLEPRTIFDATLQTNRKAWVADVTFSKPQKAAGLERLREWLKLKLPGDTIFIQAGR